jgi:hypothetical protein
MNDFLAVPPRTVLERELNNPASPARTALTATYALKSEVGTQNLDGGNATSNYSGTFNFDGGSAA